LPPGSSIYVNAALADGVLKLTPAENSQFGAFYTPALAVPLQSYNISFKMLVGGGVCCGDPTTGNPNATADGMSLNIANNLPDSPGYSGVEDGLGTGVSICFDTWDNGIGTATPREAPSIDLRWQGQGTPPLRGVLAQVSQGANMRFIPVNLAVTADGKLTLTYDGTNVFQDVQLPGYRWQTGLRVGIGGRTGGANDNHWIDDLVINGVAYDIAGPERTQTLTFQVSNSNPALFAVQPAISANGTLTYTPAPDACGSAVVTVVLKDNGGTANGGSDTSATCTFNITVNPLNDSCPVAQDQVVHTASGVPTPITLVYTDADNITGCGAAPLSSWVTLPSHGVLTGNPPNLFYTPDPGYCGADSFQFFAEDTICFDIGTVSIEVSGQNRCPVANAQSVVTCAGSAVAITLTGSDPDVATCSPGLQGFAVKQGPTHGVLSGTPPALTYTPAAGYTGPDSFTFTATDGVCVSPAATVTIAVRPAGDAPTCHIVVGPLLKLTEDQPEIVVLSCDNATAEVVLDGSLSSNPGSGPLAYMWLVDGKPVGAGAIITNTMDVGWHDVTLVVDNGAGAAGPCAGNGSSTCTTTVIVADASEATEEIILLVDQACIDRSIKKTLNKHLKDASKKFAKGKCRDGARDLEAFIDTVEHYAKYYQQNYRKKWFDKKQGIDPATAAELTGAAQAVIDALEECDCMDNQHQWWWWWWWCK